MEGIISGIQQIGMGIPDVKAAWAWYRKAFGMQVPIFEEAAEANLMLPYTGGKSHQRHAVLALNPEGGSGMEIWQYTSRTPQAPEAAPLLGDLGIFAAKIKSRDVRATLARYGQMGISTLNAEALGGPEGQPHFFLNDPYDNVFQVVQYDDWFADKKLPTGGPIGCIMGVSSIENALTLYRDILGYDQVLYDTRGTFDDFAGLPGGKEEFRRVLLTHSAPRKGSFSRMFGTSQIELVQVLSRTPRKMFEGRYWGDLGYIHLCFDIHNMEALRAACEAQGFPFTVDSSKSLGKEFDMGEASGNFSYIEDPDGTLIEFVETYKVPIAKKWGWYLDLRKRNPEKPLPNWMLKALSMNRVKD